jgi:hypothetical protein
MVEFMGAVIFWIGIIATLSIVAMDYRSRRATLPFVLGLVAIAATVLGYVLNTHETQFLRAGSCKLHRRGLRGAVTGCVQAGKVRSLYRLMPKLTSGG